MTLEWSAAALADLDRFAVFLHERHPDLAKIVATEIQAKARIIEEHPLVWRPISGRAEFRELVLEVLQAPSVFQYGYDGERLVMCVTRSRTEGVNLTAEIVARPTSRIDPVTGPNFALLIRASC